MSDNPLSGLSFPSIEEIVVRALMGFPEKDRARLFEPLCKSLTYAIRWSLGKPLEKACARAVDHSLQMMLDPNYQAKRTARRKASAVRRKINEAEEVKQRVVALEEKRQRNRGLVQ